MVVWWSILPKSPYHYLWWWVVETRFVDSVFESKREWRVICDSDYYSDDSVWVISTERPCCSMIWKWQEDSSSVDVIAIDTVVVETWKKGSVWWVEFPTVHHCGHEY